MWFTSMWILYTYFSYAWRFWEVIFCVKCYTFSHTYTHKHKHQPANRAYLTHKTLMVMIWLWMKVLFTCLDLGVLSLTAVARSILPILARVVWLEFDAILHIVHGCKVSWHTHSHTTTFVWFMRELLFFASFFFPLSVLFGLVGTYIDVCLSWAANKLMWCWILDEEFMFYARIDSLNRNQSKLPYIIEGLCTRHQFSSI